MPTDYEALGQENAATAARVRSRRRATNNSREEIGLISHVASTAEQGHGVRTQWPGSPWKQGLTDVSGARGVAAPVPRTGQCRHEWTQKKKQPGLGPQIPRKKRAQPTAGRQRAISFQSKRQERTISRIKIPPDTVHSTRSWERQVRRNAKFPLVKAAHRPRQSRQRLEVGSLSSRSSSTRPSRSLSRRRGSPDSEDRGDSSVAVH